MGSATTPFSALGLLSLVNISEVVTLGDLKSITKWGWTEINPPRAGRKALPKVLAFAEHLLNYSGPANVYLNNQCAYDTDQ